MIHKNSIEANQTVDKSTRRKEVFKAITEMESAQIKVTRQSLADFMGWPINRITPRVLELIERGAVFESEKIYVNNRPRMTIETVKGGVK